MVLKEAQHCSHRIKPFLPLSQEDAENGPVELCLAFPGRCPFVVAGLDEVQSLGIRMVLVALLVDQSAEYAVHHHVRVPTDRRREMCVMVKIECEVVRDLVWPTNKVLGLLHASPHDHHFDTLPKRGPVPAIDFLARPIQRLCVSALPRMDVQVVPHDALQDLRLQGVWRFVIPEDGRLGKRRMCKVRCHTLVGQKHQLFDDPMRR
mmetsp:Transcript_14920/g.40928  ORF Transcript_14920/g.40928 Transcript_14920/m.40928 type:complete len:206 (-) Transcript_14920:365-982(-)